MSKYYLIIIFMSLLGSLASFSFKQSAQKNTQRGILQFLHPLIILGAFLYFAASLLNIYVLKFLPYSVVLPLTAVTYIWTMILSGVVLKEHITTSKMVGVLFILAGVVCIALA